MGESDTTPLAPQERVVLPHPAVLARVNADRERVAQAWAHLQTQDAATAETWIMISHLASPDREVRQDIVNALMVAQLAAYEQTEIMQLEAALNG